MRLQKLVYTVTFALWAMIFLCQETSAQDKPAIELPVEFIGFPIIIATVRVSNFVRKLLYSLNPSTYVSRTKRSITSNDMIDVVEAEKRLVAELGEKVCIYPKVCLHHAHKAFRSGGKKKVEIDWDEIFTHYKSPMEKQKEFYLLSAFIGDIIASPKFCNQLAKRNRVCVE